MDPLLTPILFSDTTKIPELILGGSQLMKSARINPVRPEYEIPEAENRAIGLSKNLASETRLPGQSAIEGRLDESTANELATIERMGYGGASDINAASRAYGNQQDKETQLGVSAANMRLQNQRNYQQALDRYAMFQDKKWQLNKMDPYLRDAQAKAALYQAGMTNLTGGAKDIGGGISNLLLANTLYQTPEWLKAQQLPSTGQLGINNQPPVIDPSQEVFEPPVTQNTGYTPTVNNNSGVPGMEYSTYTPVMQELFNKRYRPLMQTFQ